MTRLPILGFAALLALTPAAAADLSIGFIGSLSGANASIARDQLDGFRLAVRQLGNRLGGVEFNFTVSDDRQDQALAQQAASADWEDPHLRVLILSSTSAALDHLVPQAAQHRSVIINLGAASAALAGRDCSPQLFSLSVRPSLLQELTAQYMQSQGYRRVAVLYSDHEAPELDEFRHAFKGEIIEVKSHRGSMNFAPALAQLRAAKPDAAYFLHRNGMAVEFLLQYEAAGLKQQFPLFGSADGLDQTILAASAP